MTKKPNWHDIEVSDGIVSFKEQNVQFVKFLDEGVKSTTTLNENTEKEKKVDCVNFLVEHDGKQITFNPIAKKLITTLREFYPLTNKVLRIKFNQGRRDVDNTYEVSEVIDE